MENVITLIKDLSQFNIAVLILFVYCMHRFNLMGVCQASLDQKMDDKFKVVDEKFKNVDEKFKNVDDKFAELIFQIKELVQESKELRKEFKNDISELRKEFKNEITELRAEMAKGFKEVANDIHVVRLDITRISEKQDSLHARVLLLEGAQS
ncbi:MAG: hypothetical protein QM538_06200 [Methylacidiphilales bacterium]|nr:hypothetical protein [Candidatus Methylacidiphilales bacterium]